MLYRLCWLPLVLTAVVCRADEGTVRFNRDIRPILSDNCFACHGPDEKHRQARLRLDLGGQSPVIVPGDPDASELIARITASDDSERMPPAETGKRLTKSEIDRLRHWIQEGANYEAHWSFMPLATADPPEISAGDRRTRQPLNGIDNFIWQRLGEQRLVPSPAADKSTLIRRVYLDLIGLLPSAEEVEQFVHDDRPEAYNELVDRLLKNRHYGERWGRHWLDQARYADSHGYTIDGERVMWPYRDWVIQALNHDMPFDQFTIEQLAGDLLPGGTKQQRIATGFHRNTLINQEGGTDDEQFRVEAVMDRVSTTGAVWLGLTIGCAQCHSHKFDPISHREYYAFYAFFNHGSDVNNVGPTVEIHEGELFLEQPDSDQLRDLNAAVAETERLRRARDERQRVWEASLLAGASDQRTPDQLAWTPLEPDRLSAAEAQFTLLDDHSVLATQGILRETYVVETKPLPPDAVIGSFQLRMIPHESLPQNGPGLAGNGNFVLSAVEVFLGDERLPLVFASATHAQPGYPSAALIDDDPGTGWSINVAAGSTVKMNSEHIAWLALGRAVAAEGKRLKIILRHELNNHYNVGRFQLSWSSEVAEGTADASLLEALRIPVEDRTPEQRKDIAAAFSAVDTVYKEARGRVDVLRRRLGLGPAAESMVMQELPERRDTYLLVRGDFLRPDKAGGAIEPGVPEVLPPLADDPSARPRNRLDLARWLVASNNPLTPRVTVNRIWMHYFGHGLVETENDFGRQGSPPTHPELLDWLARQFIERGWSLKELHRLIVTSATYRQASLARPDAAAVDPLNRLLARQNRLRLDAEIVRDAALSASGKLSPKMGGPSVRPPQPDGVYAFTQNRKNWPTDTGENRYRRGIYTMFYRSAPYPTLITFDSPDFQRVCTQRARSNTPLQALTMANDPAIFELARGMAHRVLDESRPLPLLSASGSANTDTRLDRLFLMAYSRWPKDEERKAVDTFLNGQRKFFRTNHDAAAAVAGESDVADPAELAAWTTVARAILNTDEFITRE